MGQLSPAASRENDRTELGWQVALALEGENFVPPRELNARRKVGRQHQVTRRYGVVRDRAIKATGRSRTSHAELAYWH